MASKIALTNEGRLSLLFLGTGSAFSKKEFQTNIVVVKGQDHFLIDCGTLCPYAMDRKYDMSVLDIDNLVLTHPHADHIGGVEEYALGRYYVKHEKPNMLITDEFKKDLWEQSLSGGLKYSEEGDMCFEDYFNQIKPEKICDSPFDIYEANIGSINIKLFRTRHVTTRPDSLEKSQLSYGIIIDDKVLFSGDTQFNPSQIEYLLEKFPIKVIFHDCDIEGNAEGVHASYEQLKTLPENIKKLMYLCHYNGAAETITPENDGFKKFAKSGVWYRC